MCCWSIFLGGCAGLVPSGESALFDEVLSFEWARSRDPLDLLLLRLWADRLRLRLWKTVIKGGSELNSWRCETGYLAIAKTV